MTTGEFWWRRRVASATHLSRVLSVSWLIREYPMGRRRSRKNVDLPAAGDPTKRMISGDDDGGMIGMESGSPPVEDEIAPIFTDVFWMLLFECAVDTGM